LDVTDLIDSNSLLVGQAHAGTDVAAASCAPWGAANELFVSFTAGFDGDLVLTTSHPSTNADTAVELRRSTCEGPVVACAAGSSDPAEGARLVVPVRSEETFVALVETSDDAAGVFSLGLHRAGVCEGVGQVQDVTAELASGRHFVVHTTGSTASARGSCSSPRDTNPEALLTFEAPRPGVMVATTAHPDTDFDTLLYVRQGRSGGASYCDTPEAEIACASDPVFGELQPALRFDVAAGTPYSLFVDGGSANGRGEATVVLGYEWTSPASTRLEGCDHESLRDDFAVFVAQGESVYLHADTVDAATAADLRLRVRAPGGRELHEADDDVACTFPPPEYSCPAHRFTAAATGLYVVEVYVGRRERCADTQRVNYRLTVTTDEAPADLICVRDN